MARLTKLLILIGLIAALGHGDMTFADAAARRKVDIEFEEVPDSSGYEIKVVRVKSGGKTADPVFFKIKKAIWTAEIHPGRYLIQLRAYDDRGVPGDWSDPFEYWVKVPPPGPLAPLENAKVNGGDEKEGSVEFSWTEMPGADRYRLEVMSEDNSIRREETTSKTKLKMTLPVAKTYTWRVISRLVEEVDGDIPETTSRFSLIGAPLKPPEPEPPLSKIVQDVHWKPVEFANGYRYSWSRKGPDGKWLILGKPLESEEPKVPFDLSQPSGHYRITVLAKGPLRLDSKPVRLEFDVRGGLRDPAAVEAEVLKESLVKPTNFYFIASYLITQVNYEAKIYEKNAAPKFESLGGTGRLGLGYQHPDKPWGIFTILDLGGITIQGKNFTFASMETHGTWKLDWRGRGQSLVAAGLFYKELPIIQGSPVTGFSGVGKVNSIGPHLGFQYWLPFNAKLGMQLNARAYYTLLGKADTGGEVKSTLSYQYGLLGSYRLGKTVMGYAGYAYRVDQALFTTNADSGPFSSPGEIDEIVVKGHYLNLVLEYSF